MVPFVNKPFKKSHGRQVKDCFYCEKKIFEKNLADTEKGEKTALQVIDVIKDSPNPLPDTTGQNLENVTILTKEELERFIKPPAPTPALKRAMKQFEEKYGKTNKSDMAERKNGNS